MSLSIFVLAGGLIGAIFGLLAWRVISTPTQTKDGKDGLVKDRYRVVALASILNDAPGPFGYFMVRYDSASGSTVSPVFYLLYLQVSNLQDTSATIQNYALEVGDSESGPWEAIYPIPLAHVDLFTTASQQPAKGALVFQHFFLVTRRIDLPDLQYSLLTNPRLKLELELNQPIQPHSTASGWVALDSKHTTGGLTRKYFRITIRDMTGVPSISTFPVSDRNADATDSSTQSGYLDATGSVVDLRQSFVRYYNGPRTP